MGRSFTSARLESIDIEPNLLAPQQISLTHPLHDLFADTGAFIVSAGLDRTRCAKALKLVVRELCRTRNRRVSAEELQRAKDYVIGQLRLSMESTTQQMMWLGEQLVSYDRIVPPDDVVNRIAAVSADQVQRVAGQIFKHRRCSLAIVAPGLAASDEMELGSQLRGLDP